MRKKKKKRKKPPNPYKGLGSVLPRGLGSRSISYTGKGNDLGRPSLPRQEAQVTLALASIFRESCGGGDWPPVWDAWRVDTPCRVGGGHERLVLWGWLTGLAWSMGPRVAVAAAAEG